MTTKTRTLCKDVPGCMNCSLRTPNAYIVPPYFLGRDVEVVFVGNYPSPGTRLPFDGKVGRPLRNSIKRIGLNSYGFTNVWRCILEEQAGAQTYYLPERCEGNLISDLTLHHHKITVTLGRPPLLILNNGEGSFRYHGTLLNTTWNGIELKIFSMMHPSLPLIEKRWKTVWEEDFDKLKGVLNEHV